MYGTLTAKLFILDWVCGVTMASSQSLVIYNEEIIPSHHKPEKTFQFGDHRIQIKQNWADEGVAGIVWDAVSCVGNAVEHYL